MAFHTSGSLSQTDWCIQMLNSQPCPSYLIAVPRELQQGVPTSLSVTVFTDSPVTVTAEVFSGNISVVKTQGTFQRGLTELQTLPPILDNASSPPHLYVLVVNGHVGNVSVFTNTTVMQLKALSFSTIIQTDKSHYEPGQAVKIRAISIYPGGKPHKAPADITIKDPKGNLVQQWLLVDGTLGVVSKEFQLSKNPPLGMWTISVSVNGVDSKRNFTVEYYEQPKFEVLVKVPTVIHYEDNLFGSVSAQYPYGKPVRGVLTVMAEFELFGSIFSANKTKKINGSADFVFSEDDFADQFNMYEGSVRSTDSMDKLVVNVTACVTETLTGLKYNRTMVVAVVNQKYHLNFYNHPKVLKPSLNFTAQLKVSLYNQNPLTLMDRATNVIINVTQRRYPELSRMESGDMESSSLHLSLPVPQDGIVNFQFQLMDQVSVLTILAQFQGTVQTLNLYRDYSSPSMSYIQIHRSNSSAHVGNPLWFTANSSYPLREFQYLVTSRGHLVETGTVTSMSFSLTPKVSWVPLAHLVVYSVRSDGEIVNDATSFPVHQFQRNNVSLNWSQANVRPEQEVSLMVTVTEPRSLVGIWVVDKMTNCPELSNNLTEKPVLGGLTEDNMDENNLLFAMSGDPFSTFRAGNIMVLTDATLSPRERFEVRDEMQLPQQGVDWEPQVCRDSPETWLWLETNVSTSTTANLPFTVPDRITSWFASAFVVSDNLGLGLMSTPVKLTVFQNVFMTLDLPPFIIRGEQLVLEIQVYNNLELELKALVIVEESDSFEFIFADNQSSSSAGARSVSVQSRNDATVLFPIRPKVLGMMSVTAKVMSFFASDTVTSTVLVKSEGIEKSFSKSLFLELVPSNQNHSSEITFTLPPDVVPGSQRAEVTAVGNILGPSLSGLESLIQMPYGCGEQNMIHFAPSIYVLQYLTITGQVEEAVYSRAIQFMMEGYQRELSYQRGDGSFSAFGDSDASGSTWLSAFVLRCFLQARPFIMIDVDVLSKTAAWLVSQQGSDGAFLEPGRVIHTELQGGLDGPVSLTAYALMALLEDQANKDLYASTVTNALSFLESKLSGGVSSNYSLSLVAYALSLAEHVSAQTALNELLSRADVKDGVVFWRMPGAGLSASWQPRSANIEMAAYALLSLFTQAKVVEGISLMKWLSQQRNHLGGYGSTQDTVVALQALSHYAAFSGSDAIDLWITVKTMNSQVVARLHINSANSLLLQSQEIEVGKDVHLNVSIEGRGFALFQLNVFYNLNTRTLSRRRSNTMSDEAFDLDVRVTDTDLNHVSLTICTRLREGQQIVRTGMALMEVSMLTGLRPVEGGVRTNDVVRKVETPPGKVVLYLDSVTTSQVCIDIPTVRDFKVANVQDGTVLIYDYYEPRRKVERAYNSDMMRRTSLCSFCGKDCGSCGEKPKSGGVSVSGPRHNNVRSLACALVILAALMR
ncbi:CD109 antigen-like isoform X2 [Anguilla rostrata]|uniref:CD109 antigen-like isoform X2 n=2 Tax=Anguilla rostrata TaxID=7938 RepID=UPI0030D16D46